MRVKVINTEGLSSFEINTLVQQGAKFVSFPYSILKIFKEYRRNYNVYFIRPNESSFKYSLRLLFTNMTVGWWAYPWKPLEFFKSLYYILIGGKDLTENVLRELNS
jgi:hypothetical protein